MLVDSINIVPVDTFRKDLSKYLAAAQGGRGPVAITKDAEIVGFLIGRDEYEAMFGSAVSELLEFSCGTALLDRGRMQFNRPSVRPILP